eukprot:6978672-Prymnesium_polylepis.1
MRLGATPPPPPCINAATSSAFSTQHEWSRPAAVIRRLSAPTESARNPSLVGSDGASLAPQPDRSQGTNMMLSSPDSAAGSSDSDESAESCGALAARSRMALAHAAASISERCL